MRAEVSQDALAGHALRSASAQQQGCPPETQLKPAPTVLPSDASGCARRAATCLDCNARLESRCMPSLRPMLCSARPKSHIKPNQLTTGGLGPQSVPDCAYSSGVEAVEVAGAEIKQLWATMAWCCHWEPICELVALGPLSVISVALGAIFWAPAWEVAMAPEGKPDRFAELGLVAPEGVAHCIR